MSKPVETLAPATDEPVNKEPLSPPDMIEIGHSGGESSVEDVILQLLSKNNGIGARQVLLSKLQEACPTASGIIGIDTLPFVKGHNFGDFVKETSGLAGLRRRIPKLDRALKTIGDLINRPNVRSPLYELGYKKANPTDGDKDPLDYVLRRCEPDHFNPEIHVFLPIR